MDSNSMRKRAAWMARVAQRLNTEQASPLVVYALKLARIADDIDTYRPPRVLRHA